MKIIADLHLHSKYSRAVSSRMTIPQMAEWGRKKGIDVLATSDWTHPLWLKEVKTNLEEAGEGIFSCRSAHPRGGVAPAAHRGGELGPFFLLSTEISSIYSQGGRLRKIHNLVLAPNFEAVEKINIELNRRGCNLMADGRPITGISSRDLTDLILSIDEKCLIVPAHIWTPHFSLFGSNSGFDSLEECFTDLSDRIYGIETGLSSDPAMNWRIKELDKRSILSFSDAHSPEKLGREVTVFSIKDKNLSYAAIRKAIQKHQIAYTIEFYPQEGKYHYTGHRNCGITQSPEETKKLGAVCPVCGKKLTVGVMHRVEQLAGRPAEFKPANRPPYKMLVPLMEILAESLAIGVISQAVKEEYHKLISRFGSEFNVLLKTKPEEIAEISGERVAEGILRVRSGQLHIEPGYDGVFGKVKIWPDLTKVAPAKQKQMSLF